MWKTFKNLPIGTKRLLSLGVVLGFVVALPLFIWAVVSQQFDIRERADILEPTLPPVSVPTECNQTCGGPQMAICPQGMTCYTGERPGIPELRGLCRNPNCPTSSNCSCTPPTPTPPPPAFVNWTTQWASFSADNYKIQISGGNQPERIFTVKPSKPCNTQTGEMVCVHSNPPNFHSNEGLHYMSLEVQWFENDIEMRMFIYLYSDGVKWWSNEIRVYNGQPNPNTEWIYYYGKFFEAGVGQPFNQNQQMGFAGNDPKNGNTVKLSFSDLKFQAFKNYSFPTPTPSPTPSVRCNQTCGGVRSVACPQGMTCYIGNRPSIPELSGVCRNPNCPTSSNCFCTPPTPTATPTPRLPLVFQILKFQFKFEGVTDDSADGATLTARFYKPGTFDYISSSIEASYVANGIYQTVVSFVPQSSPSIPVGDGYAIFLKGEKHVAKKFCYQTGQTTRCTTNGYIYIGATNVYSEQTFDFTGLPLEPGDLPPQDGVVNSEDFAKVKNLMAKLCSSLTAEEKYTADLDYNGCVNVRDAFLLRKTLETRFDEY